MSWHEYNIYSKTYIEGSDPFIQGNIQKEFRPGVDLSSGWAASMSGAWNVWGATIDFGGGGSASWTYLKD